MGMTGFSAVVSVFTLRMHYGMFVNAPPGWVNRVTTYTFGHNAAGVKTNISHTHSVSTEENVSLETISTVSSPRVRIDNATSATTEQSLHIAIDKLLAGAGCGKMEEGCRFARAGGPRDCSMAPQCPWLGHALFLDLFDNSGCFGDRYCVYWFAPFRDIEMK